MSSAVVNTDACIIEFSEQKKRIIYGLINDSHIVLFVYFSLCG